MKHLIVGPDGHGVTDYALQLAKTLGVVGTDVVREETFSDTALPDGPIHVTFTDHIFGASPSEAVDALLARVGERPLSVSFHDIPQREEGAERYQRRADAYRRLAGAAALATVNSEHEAAFFDDTATVIRLPVPRVDSSFNPEPGTVGILGFLYPGKGHEDLIAALRGTGYRLRFLGSVSAGHEKWARGLEKDAEITGWLSDGQLAREIGRTAVPVCAHRHFSASGSLMTWLGAGRNVLASDSPYTREIDAWLPGRITLVSDGDWCRAVDNFTPRTMEPPRYGWDEVAAAWREAWAACGLT
ncbi:glycosyltransferase family 1 protein [Corynebacterium qintianiae]|uniref:Glycosyltransferase family 1 protein n=1 Tax=Corynebacterium qintianiae TaxID=2709392 RepID=A0A7T0PE68_9CORY|nr:glycosyltransferase family 4 protein [Corynebacterium qintianiae]QPK82876.1 glycosyltransferase family 1 protein [Corynebacterium qintianiae]